LLFEFNLYRYVETERRRLIVEHVAKRMNKSVGFIFEQWSKYAVFEGRMKGILEKAEPYKSNSVDPHLAWLERTWFQPLNLSSDILVFKFLFRIQLVPLRKGGPHPGQPSDEAGVRALGGEGGGRAAHPHGDGQGGGGGGGYQGERGGGCHQGSGGRGAGAGGG
jgi:hypothetical protein